MKAHTALEMLERMRRSQSLDEGIADDLEKAIVQSQKFELCIDDIPAMKHADLVGFAKDAHLPFRSTFFEIPGVGALLAKEYSDSFLIQPFFSINGEKGMAPPQMNLAMVKDGLGILCGAADEDLRDRWDKSSNSAVKNTVIFMVKVVIATLAILRCNNVISVDNPAPAALNKKREKAGKPPIFSFKTLHIKAGSSVEKIGSGASGDRNGPRLHMRRGHIRRLSAGATTWVQSCMVGSAQQGMVFKDYKVTA